MGVAAAVGEVDLDALVNLDDFERAARAVMDAQDFDYFAGGAESETTMRANSAAFADVTLWPRCLVDVSDVDTSASFPELGLPRLAAPLIAAPVAMQKMAHPGGESAAARACAARRVAYCASQQATTRVETIAEALTDVTEKNSRNDRRASSAAAPSREPKKNPRAPEPRHPMWFQLYVFEDRSKTVDLIRRAEKAGAVAFAVTVDAPVLGRRERDVRNKFAMRAGMRLDNVARDSVTHDSDTTHDALRAQGVVRRGGVNGADEAPKREASARSASRENAKNAQATLSRRVGGRDASLTWSFLRWIKTVTDAPIILKGVTRRDDAARAVDAGVAALWVSNHGGRQLDGAPAALDALPEIVAGSFGSSLFAKNPKKGARKKVPVIFDGGVRRGADILKALALGADLVAFGRPLVWGLACGGEEGVDRVIQTLDEELRTAMALCGVNRLDKASLADLARRRGDPPPGRRPRRAYSRL